MRTVLVFLSVLLGSFPSTDQHSDDILGVWQNGSGKGHIEIYKQNGKYYGKIIWLREALDAYGRPKTDRKNENPHLRNKPLIGLVMMRDFVYDDGEWVDGHIYNPSDGKTYKAYMNLKDRNTLEVRGYVGISLIGKTDIWTRAR
jgi:uncharacterized protein (DUF2147 family)